MRILCDEKTGQVSLILSLPGFAVVEPASTFATLDNFPHQAIRSWPLISKAIRVSAPFGTSTANAKGVGSRGRCALCMH
jgi:hypothetical protein